MSDAVRVREVGGDELKKCSFRLSFESVASFDDGELILT